MVRKRIDPVTGPATVAIQSAPRTKGACHATNVFYRPAGCLNGSGIWRRVTWAMPDGSNIGEGRVGCSRTRRSRRRRIGCRARIGSCARSRAQCGSFGEGTIVVAGQSDADAVARSADAVAKSRGYRSNAATLVPRPNSSPVPQPLPKPSKAEAARQQPRPFATPIPIPKPRIEGTSHRSAQSRYAGKRTGSTCLPFPP